MKGIPPEIDALMWQLAEQGGPVAQAEFEARHVRYAPELSRRIRMVAELRAAGKAVAHRPAFTPRPARTAPTPRWAVGAVAGLAVLAVGAVAYVATSTAERPAPGATPHPVPKIDVAPAPVPEPTVVRQEPTVPPVSPPPASAETSEPKPERRPKYLEPRDVQIAETSLVNAIKLVAAGGGLQVTIAPGFEDKTVSLDYTGAGLNTIEILKAMGEEHGFSVLDEGEGQALVIPVRETADRSRRTGP